LFMTYHQCVTIGELPGSFGESLGER
jgi:hypothetical protein